MRRYNGQASRWYQGAALRKAGRIIAAGRTKEVTFEPVDGPVNDLVDAATPTSAAALLGRLIPVSMVGTLGGKIVVVHRDETAAES